VHAAYLILERIAPNPMVTLNRAVALAETEGPQAGLALLATLDGDERMAGHHRLLSVRAHLLERAGDPAAAYQHYRRAARSTASLAEQRYLESRASRVRPRSDGLLARLRRGAVDLRVHAQVVKRTGDERHRDRADLGATTDGPVVVTALACGNRADDQPDDNQQRPDAHRDPLT
jgi:hypothetical protein